MAMACKHCANMLLNLINDLLDLAKQERFTFHFNKSYFSLIDAISSTFNTLKFLADQKKVKIKLLVDPSEMKFFHEIYGDVNRYEQMLINFISNAIKFTRPGTQVEVILHA
jgi:osomolarity two-component system sensor histidine kinase NIK1